MDPQVESILKLLNSIHLVDLKMDINGPTSYNGRQGNAMIYKRIDRVIVKSHLLARLESWKAKIGSLMLSFHRPILFSWDLEVVIGGKPFKFNRCWLEDPDFKQLVKTYLGNNPRLTKFLATDYLMSTLRGLKRVLNMWERGKRFKLKVCYLDFEKETIFLLKELEKPNPVAGTWDRLKAVEREKRKIMIIEEQTWRLKRRVIWLKVGDRNMKFFHAFVNGRKNVNTI